MATAGGMACIANVVSETAMLGHFISDSVSRCGDSLSRTFVRVVFGKKLRENWGLGLDKVWSWGTIEHWKSLWGESFQPGIGNRNEPELHIVG